MKHFRNRPAVRRAAIISVAAAAPLLLASCGGATAEDKPADAGKAPGESIAQPKQAGSLTKAQPEQAAAADPVSVPKGEADFFIPEVELFMPGAEAAAHVSDRVVHTVTSGDTLAGIADAYGWGDWLEVAAYNNIPAPHILFEGQRISAPGNSHAAAAPATRPAAVFTPASTEPVKDAAPKAPVAPAPADHAEPAPAPVVEAPAAVIPKPEVIPVEVPVAAEPVEDPAPVVPVVEAPTAVAPAPVEPAPVPAVPKPVPAPATPAPVVTVPAAPAPVVTVPEAPAPVEVPVQTPAAPAPSGGSTVFAQRSLELINEYRAANGVHALAYDDRLETMAVNWAGSQKESIEANGWAGIAHNPNLAAELPAGWTNYGENIAVNYSPEDMFTWWTNSPAHNAGMLSPALDAFGFGSAELDIFAGNHVGVQVFARY